MATSSRRTICTDEFCTRYLLLVPHRQSFLQYDAFSFAINDMQSFALALWIYLKITPAVWLLSLSPDSSTIL